MIMLQRGPLVYCLEGKDQPDGKVFPYFLSDTAHVISQYREDLLGGIIILQMQGKHIPDSSQQQITMNNNLITTNNNLMTTSDNQMTTNDNLTAIPYCYWANRGPGEMTVWLKAGQKDSK
jgi:hypothetical protein